ncbi:MAG: hypothetical protein FJW61_05915 [Actinobacteria bacterium]|nr:hypothetical protein [Actinomycetota bacterium]
MVIIMMKSKILVYLISVLVIIGGIFIFWYIFNTYKQKVKTTEELTAQSQTEQTQSELFSKLQERTDYKFGSLGTPEKESLPKLASMEIYWIRPHPGEVIWDKIEDKSGSYNWKPVDEYIKKAQSLGVHVFLTIWPYAEWDQDECHSDLPSTPDPFGRVLPERKGIPCDWGRYQKFLSALVERYDGDGQEDMPGLIYPVNYFEIGNEPEMHEGNNIFFQGTPEDFAILLKKSSEPMRKANPDVKILHGGIASSGDFSKEFWGKVFSQEGISEHFDIANVHDLQGAADANVEFIKNLLKENGITEKPIWVTEFTLFDQPMAGPPSGASDQQQKQPMNRFNDRVKEAFSAGAEKIFLLLPRPQDIDEQISSLLKQVIAENS